MEKQTLNYIASATSTVRDHSPYCEATGPIVREGFVASRVRDIQAKCDITQPTRSHSPLIPCPVPRWCQISDCITPPQSLFSRCQRISQGRDINIASAIVPLPARGGPANRISTVIQPSISGVTAQSSSMEVTEKDERIISSPKPIIPISVTPDERWILSNYGKGYHSNNPASEPEQRSRNKAADKSGLLVERGWVGCDVFGKVHGDRVTSDLHVSPQKSCRDLHSEKQSQWVAPREESLPLQMYLDRDENASVSNLRQDSEARDRPSSPGIDPRLEDSNVRHLRGSRVIQPKISTRRQYFGDRQSHQSAFEKLSLSQEIDRHLSQWENTLNSGAEQPSPGTNARTDLQIDYQKENVENKFRRTPSKCSSPTMSETTCLPTTNVQPAKPPGLRSASWFSKLASLKLVLVDRAPIMQSFTRRTSEPTPTKEEFNDQNQHQHEVSSREPSPTAEQTGALPRELVSHANGEIYAKGDPAAPQLFETSVMSDNALSGLEASKSFTSAADYTTCKAMPTVAALPSRSPQPLSQLLQPADEIRQDTFDGPSEGDLSRVPSSLGQSIEESITSTKNASTTKSPKNESHAVSKSSKSKHMSTENTIESREGQAAETVFHRPKRLIQEQAKQMDDSARWEVAGNGKGIKRIQVIVSLDGADDLVVDAQLLGPLQRDSESQTGTQDLIGKRFSDCSTQLYS